MESGKALVLVDGIDELPETQRPAVGAWLSEMIQLFPGVRYVVTTRPGAADGIGLGELGFVVSNLEPMDPVEVRRFISQWHLAMLEWQTDDQERERITDFQVSLINKIENDRFLRDLADTPLLAGLLCALNQHLKAQLPNRRGEVFEKALVMFDQRDRARGIQSAISVDLAAANHLLGDLALWMVRNGVAEVPLPSVVDVIARSASSLPSGPYDAAVLSRYLLLRSGLLREPTAGNVDFVHKSFQEYLAAKALMAADNMGELLRNATQDQWQQVVVFSAGQGNLRQTTDLLKGLLSGSSRPSRRRLLLAIACMDETHSAAPEVLILLDETTQKLMPPRSIEEAEMLSHAGPRIVPLLARVQLRGVKRKVATIRTASLVGGYEAMKVVANIARSEGFDEEPFIARYLEDDDVYSEVMRAWQYFDPGAYATEVLAPSGLDSVTVEDTRMLRHIAHVESLRNVTLEVAGELVDLTILDDLPQLEGLCFVGASFNSLTGVIHRWPGLNFFKVLAVPQLADISALSLLPGIEQLEFSYCDSLDDYSVFAKLPSLRYLWLQGQDEPDLSSLAKASSLREMTICEAGVVDLRPLAGLPDLQIIVFDDTEIADLPADFRPIISRNPRKQ